MTLRPLDLNMENVKLLKLGPDLFKIQSFTNPPTYYIIDTLVETCTCSRHKYRGSCKHMRFVHAVLYNGEGSPIYPSHVRR